METAKTYEKRIELLLGILGITRYNPSGKLKKYADVEPNAFTVIKRLYIHTYTSYNDEELTFAINNIMSTLYLIED